MARLILLIALALGATAVQAENGLFYVGAGVTSNSLTENVGGYIHTDLKNTSWKAFAGVRPLRWLAAEADYIDLGSGNGDLFGNEVNSTSHADGSAWAAFAVGFLPLQLPAVEFYGKVGVARWKLNSSITLSYLDPQYSPSTTSMSRTGNDFAWGIGMQARFGIAGVRLEYEGFNVHSNYAQVASLSLFVNL